MLLRILGCACLAGSMFVLPARADVIDVSSGIAQAVVYPAGARVTRIVKVPLTRGPQTVRFKDVLPNFDENSVSVSGSGSARVRILGAGITTEFLKETADERVRGLEARIQEADDALAAMQEEAVLLDTKRSFLDSVRLFTSGQLPKDLVTKVPAAEELKATLLFLEDGMKAHGEARLALALRQREKLKERQALQNELNQLRSGGPLAQRSLAVDLECVDPGELTLEVSYTVMQVGWAPLYDARVEFEKGKAELSAFAVVRQTTGEDWTDVKLTLSTARPSVGGRMPELSPWYLRPLQRHDRARVQRISGFMAKGVREMVMSAADDIGDQYEAAGAPAPTLAAEVVYAQAEASGVSLVYRTPRPVSVKSDGSEVRVPLMVQSLDASFEYAATPKLSAYAYLKSRVANSPQDPLLAGPVNIFLDGTFVGASTIPATVAPGEKFDLYLGVDEGVVVKRQLVSQKSDDTLVGGIPSPTRKIAYEYKITAENFKLRQVTLKLFDQVPVAQDDKIKVVKVQASLKPESEKYEDREGVYLWTLVLAPKEKKEITLTYVVEYPRDMRVDGL